jgi:hypothetical protein
MSFFKDKVASKIDDAADATKRAADKVIDGSEDAAHTAGEKLEDTGKKLEDA